MNILIAFQLGEVEVSNLTILVLVFFSSFTFVAVGISSYKLYKSLINEDDNWSERRDLNPRPPLPQSGALPNCATPRSFTIKFMQIYKLFFIGLLSDLNTHLSTSQSKLSQIWSFNLYLLPVKSPNLTFVGEAEQYCLLHLQKLS